MRVTVSVRLGRKEARERTRQELLAAAARVFAAKGFAGASVDDVAEAAGYTKGAVYSNFASKTDLMLALIEDRIRRQSEVIEDAFNGVTLEEGFRDLGARTSGPAALDREWMMLVGEFMLYAMRDERARVALAAEYERARGLSAALIASKYLAAGTTPPIPARDIAIIIESLGIGLGFQALIDPTGVSTDLEAVAVERILGPGPQPATPATPATPAVPTVPERPPKPARPKVPGPKKPKGR
ncbi:MAG: TetR/AcrR family transcriptional regulator [Chloroflexi bacterium]|nr:TetR/AcrR family transcriptional regulator [Chloroflexota bacterium]